jgi:hypothetical protein
MTRRTAILALVGAALTALLCFGLVACNSTPTVPVPPPEFCAVSPPDETGLCEVGCGEGYTDRDVALVYNEDWGQGVMQATNDDGSFTVEVEANPGDDLVIQLKHGNDLSAEVWLTVPAE